MAVEIMVRAATPENWEEFDRDFRPVDVSECDRTIRKVGEDGRVRLLQMRVREVRVISADQNSIKTLVWELGPATGEAVITIPCDQAVDVAQAHDLLQAHMEQWYPMYVARRAAAQEDRQQRFVRALIQEADEQTKRKLGLSTFGPGGFKQREKGR